MDLNIVCHNLLNFPMTRSNINFRKRGEGEKNRGKYVFEILAIVSVRISFSSKVRKKC